MSAEPPVLLLHGLAGYGGEWAATVRWLADRRYVAAAPDAIGHGSSERRPADVSQDAHVRQSARAVEALGGGPAIVIGHSLGGVTAMLIAARRPELVGALVVVEASPDGGEGPDLDAHVARLASGLRSWPVPFTTREEALAFFAGRGPAPEVWVAGLERGEDGLHPRFEVDIMTETLRQALAHDHWAEWEQIRCPTLIVRGDHGTLDAETASKMAAAIPTATVAEITAAGHDPHLEQPTEWLTTLARFLDGLDN